MVKPAKSTKVIYLGKIPGDAKQGEFSKGKNMPQAVLNT